LTDEQRRATTAFADAVRIVAMGTGLTQGELLRRAELGRTAHQRIVLGLEEPTLTGILRIADALDVKAAVLMRMTSARLNGET